MQVDRSKEEREEGEQELRKCLPRKAKGVNAVTVMGEDAREILKEEAREVAKEEAREVAKE